MCNYILYWLASVVRVFKLRRAGHVAGRSAFKILTDKPTGNKPLGRPTRRWEDQLEWMLKKQVPIRGIGLIRLKLGIFEEPM